MGISEAGVTVMELPRAKHRSAASCQGAKELVVLDISIIEGLDQLNHQPTKVLLSMYWLVHYNHLVGLREK